MDYSYTLYTVSTGFAESGHEVVTTVKFRLIRPLKSYMCLLLIQPIYGLKHLILI